MLLAAIPLKSTKWGGLSRPSSPKAECQAKSAGPAATSTITPAATILAGHGIIILLPAADLAAVNSIAAPATAMATPEYRTA
jgi:hypothetical protein